MKFDYCIGNPPYQASDNNMRLYPSFYVAGQQVANCVEQIFPCAWREAKNTNGLSIMNTESIKRDKQIVRIIDEHNVFAGVAGAEWTNIIIWKKNYDNGLNGNQKIIDENGIETIIQLPITKDDVPKPYEILAIVDKVNALGEPKIMSMVSASKPYGFRADPLDNPDKYGLTLLNESTKTTVRLFGKEKGKGRSYKYIERALLPKVSANLDKYKLFVVKAWGNMDEKQGFLGGSYSQLILAEPCDCCSEMYIEVGPFNTKKEAECAFKYFKTKFLRAVFYKDKLSQNTAKETYASIPLQDFTEKSDIDWSKSIKEIDQQLYAKYGLTQDEIDFIETHVKEME